MKKLYKQVHTAFKNINKKYIDIYLITSILILTSLININLFSVPYIYDDYDFLFYWHTIRDFNHIPDLLQGNVPAGHEGVYRPLRSIFYVISLNTFGHNIFYYHIQELIIYSFCIVLIYLITQKMLGKQLISLFTALSYAMLSIHIDNVANLTASFDTIGIIFFFLSFYLFQHTIEHHKKHTFSFLVLSLISSLLAYMTYEITLILPLLILVYYFFKQKKIPLNYYTYYIFITASYLFMRFNILHISARGSFMDNLPYKLINSAQSLLSYLLITIFPIKTELTSRSSVLASLAFSQAEEPMNQTGTGDSQIAVISIIIILITIIIAVLFFKKRKILGFGVIWFYISLLPAVAISIQSTILSGITQPVWPRYAVIASFGMCLIFANWLYRLFYYNTNSAISQHAKVAGIIVIITLTFLNAITYSNNLKTWRGITPEFLKSIQTLKDNDESKHNDLGVIYAASREFPESLSEFRKALKINPEYPVAKQNLQKLCQIIKKATSIDAKTKSSCH